MGAGSSCCEGGQYLGRQAWVGHLPLSCPQTRVLTADSIRKLLSQPLVWENMEEAAVKARLKARGQQTFRDLLVARKSCAAQQESVGLERRAAGGRTELGRELRKGSFPFWQLLHLTQLRAGLLIRPGFATVLVISLYGTNYPKIQ